MDFTLTTYKKFLHSLLINDYSFQTFHDFIQQPNNKKIVILRHDVDRLPSNALVIAEIEKDTGIKASYYFRIVKEGYDENIIKQIAEMGHEIGYHYENLSTCGGDLRLAIDDFRLNLEKLSKLYPVKTICMHGSPLSEWDNRDLWKKYDYRDFGIIGEPYFDVDFGETFYVTDTGRKWNNSGASIRDRVDSRFDIEIKSTHHFIELIKQGLIPDKMMINVHPQRWTDKPLPWVKELVWQNLKNVVKRYMIKLRD